MDVTLVQRLSGAPPCSPLDVEAAGDGYLAITSTPSNATKSKLEDSSAPLQGGALRSGGAANIYSREYIGVLAQYAVVGVVMGALPGTIYPFLLNYLNMEGTQIVSAKVLLGLPWSLKVIFGLLTDCFPIRGYRRRPYMLLGWTVCFGFLAVLAASDVGAPYFADRAIAKIDPRDYTEAQRALVHPQARGQGSKVIVLMMLATVGFVCADVAADAIVVELAQREPLPIRGRTQTAIYFVRAVFTMLVNILLAVGFSGKDYGGEFTFTLSFPQLMLAVLLVCLPILPITWFFIHEERVTAPISFRAYMRQLWELIQTRAMYQVLAYKFFHGLFDHFTYTATQPMQTFWVGATPFNEKISTIIGNAVFAITLFTTGRVGLHWNWRMIAAVTTFAVIAMDAVVTMLTTWDIVRNQWFWLGAPIAEQLPQGVNYIVGAFVMVELAGHGNEGAVFGLVTTVANMSTPLANTLTKIINGQFDVTNQDIQSDTAHARMEVTTTILICYGVRLLGFLWLPLLPPQKLETQRLVKFGGSSKRMGIITVIYCFLGLVWSTTINLLSIYPSTQCLRVAGGRGCPS